MKKVSILFPFFLLYTLVIIGQESNAIKQAIEAIVIKDNGTDKLYNFNDLKGRHRLNFELYLIELKYGTILKVTLDDESNISFKNNLKNKIINYYNRFNNNLNSELKDKFLLYEGIARCSDEGLISVTLYLADENNYGFDIDLIRATDGITYIYNSNNYKKEKIVFKSDLKKIKKVRKELKNKINQ